MADTSNNTNINVSTSTPAPAPTPVLEPVPVPVIAPTKTIVDPIGDVVFLVGSDVKHSILVSSKVLTVASRVFMALFKPWFREGIELLAANKYNEPYEIPLPEDDPDAMVILCKILHVRHDDLDLTPNIKKMKSFAAVADKYDCLDASKFFMTVWLSKVWLPTTLDHGNLMVIAYRYNDHVAFEASSKQMISAWTHGSDYTRRTIDPEDVLPSGVFESLGSCRAELVVALKKRLTTPITYLLPETLDTICKSVAPHGFDNLPDNTRATTHDSHELFGYMSHLHSLGMWPLENLYQLDIGICLIKLEWHRWKSVMSDFGHYKASIPATATTTCKACNLGLKARIDKSIFEVRGMLTGLCLDCVRSGAEQGKGVGCRMKH